MLVSFEEFISEEVKPSKRQGMKHFQDMKPAEFIEWIWSIKSEMKGVLKNIKTVLKVDGSGLRFGRDQSGRVFIEGSRTGPIFDSAAFSSYAKSRGASEEIVLRATHYDNMFELFKNSRLMKAIPNDTKVSCEVFYNPMAEESEDGIRFVTVKYDKNKLGKVMTILPYGVTVASTGEDHPLQKEILGDLMSLSDSDVKVIDPSLKMGPIDINGIIDPIAAFNKDSLKILSSRKSVDAAARQNLLSVVNRVKEELYHHIIFNKNISGLDKLCAPEDNEGICLYLSHGTFKMTSKKFQQAHHGG